MRVILSLYSCILVAFTFPINIYALDTDLGDLNLFKIVWKGPITNKEPSYINEDNVINISTATNDRYRCIVPSDQRDFDTSARNSSSKEEPSKTPAQVLLPLLYGNYCSYNFELFWVYELCHGKFLRQYHEEKTKYKTKVTQEYYLGRMNERQVVAQMQEYELEKAKLERTGQSRPTILVNGRYKPYVMFQMSEGTPCDLTEKSRVAKIIYVCNEEQKNELYSIKETSTCEYEAIVLTPFLCLHEDFKVEANTQHEISCYTMSDAPRRPPKTIEMDEEEETKNRRRSVAYFQGGTLIIDADLILS